MFCSCAKYKTMVVALFGYHFSLTRAFSIFVDNYPSTALASPAATINRCLSPQRILRSITPTILHSSNKDDIIDVEFEFQEPENTSIGTGTKQRKRNRNVDDIDGTSPQNLLDAALQMGDPELSSIPFEFIDPESTTRRFIECKIAFVVEKDGITYSIGTPCDAQVAVLFEGDMTPKAANEQKPQMQYFIDPDEDVNLELMEKAAAAFIEEYGDTCKAVFKRTPRALTIEGDLDSITGDWRRERNIDQDQNQKEGGVSEKIFEDFANIEDDADSDEFFDSFFKERLGEGYREEVLAQNEEVDKKANELMDLFNIPGVGTQKDDDKGIDKMLEDIINGKDLAKATEMEEGGEDQLEETGLRLLGFTGPDGKAYSLVKLIQPMVLVAKDDPELGPDQKMLLTVEEANIVVPRLEDEFKKEFGDLNKD